MASQLLLTTDSGASFFVALDWRVLPINLQVDNALREVARDKSSKFAVRLNSLVEEEITLKNKKVVKRRTTAGLWNDGVDEIKPPRKSHAFAACFALAALQQHHGHAILCVSNLAENLKAKTLVVVVINGVPVVDKLCDTATEAHAIITSYKNQNSDFQIFTDNNVTYPQSIHSDDLLSEVTQFAQKSTALKPIPIDLVWWFVVASVLCAALGGYYYYDKEKKRKAAEAAEAARIAADPVPKYLSALATERMKSGASTKSLVQSYQEAMKIASGFNGWTLKRASCILNSVCQLDLLRTTGTFALLENEAKSLKLNIKPNSTNLSEAMLFWDSKLDFQPLQTELPNLTEFIKGTDGSKLQNWQTAKLNVTLAPSILWPQVPGVPASFKNPNALLSGKAETNSIKLPQMIEVFSTQPTNIVWNSWVVDVNAASSSQDILGAATGTVKGNYYVKQ